MSWLDRLNPTDRAALQDAGRLGRARFERPLLTRHDSALDGCGMPWVEHDNRDPRNVLPFGCPPRGRAA